MVCDEFPPGQQRCCPMTRAAALFGHHMAWRYGNCVHEHRKAASALALARTSPLAPALFGGVGVYHVTISVTAGGATTDNSAARLAWHVGGGVAYRALFLDIRYVSVAAVRGFPKTTLFPVTAGVRF